MKRKRERNTHHHYTEAPQQSTVYVPNFVRSHDMWEGPQLQKSRIANAQQLYEGVLCEGSVVRVQSKNGKRKGNKWSEAMFFRSPSACGTRQKYGYEYKTVNCTLKSMSEVQYTVAAINVSRMTNFTMYNTRVGKYTRRLGLALRNGIRNKIRKEENEKEANGSVEKKAETI